MSPALRKVLLGEETHGTTLLVWALDELGPGPLGGAGPDDPPGGPHEPWAPETIRLAIRDLGVELPAANFDKLMGAVAVLTTDLFWRDVRSFVAVAGALCGNGFDPGVFEPVDAAECAWAITEALLLDPPGDGDPDPFSDEVRLYVGHALREEGLLDPPDVLGIALGVGQRPPAGTEAAAVQAAMREDIEGVVSHGLAELMVQLDALPLRHGSTRDLCARLRAGISAKADARAKGV